MAGFFAHGATISFNAVQLGGVLDIPLPEEVLDEIETTDMDSALRREFVSGLIDGSTLDITMRMIVGDLGQAELRTNVGSGTEQAVIIQAPGGMGQPEWTFNAFVQTYGGTLFWESSAAERTVTLRITGAVTEAAQA